MRVVNVVAMGVVVIELTVMQVMVVEVMVIYARCAALVSCSKNLICHR